MSYQIAELLDGVSVGENRNRSNQNFQNLLALINEHGFVWNGDYIDSFEYRKGDVVRYNHSLYIAKVPTVGLIPTNTSAWDLLVESFQGEIGPTGPQGTGITSIVRTSGSGTPGTFDTYTITFSNATTTTFQVWNGTNGTGDMNKSDNLSGLADYTTARTNMGVYSKAEVDGLTHVATAKTTPVDADEIPLSDSESSWSLKKLTWANLKAALNNLYVTLTGAQTIGGLKTFTNDLTLNGSNKLNVSSGGGLTPDAINIGSGGIILGQNNGDGVVRSGFANKIFRFRNSSSVDRLTIALDTGDVAASGVSYFGISNTQNGQIVSANGSDHVYFGWLVNLARKAYIGFPGAGNQVFQIVNEFINGNINFQTNGTGQVMINSVGMSDFVKNQFTTINSQTGTSYTFALTDAWSMVTFNNAAAQTVTVPPNSSVAFPIGTQIDCAQLGAGKVTFAQGAGVTIQSKAGNKAISAQYVGATLKKIGTDTWLLLGDLIA